MHVGDRMLSESMPSRNAVSQAMPALIDFFLIMYAEDCISDGESLFSKMARFIRGGAYQDLLGFDG